MTIAEALMQTLFGYTFLASMDEILIPMMAMTLAFSIPIIAIVIDYLQKRTKARIIERALERGVPIENLALDEPRRNRLPYRSGMILVATGIGVMVFGLAMSWGLERAGEEDAFMGMATMGGGGVIVLLIGIAQLINDRINRDRFNNGAGKDS